MTPGRPARTLRGRKVRSGALALVLALVAAFAALAQESASLEETRTRLEQFDREARLVDARIAAGELSEGELEDLRNTLARQRTQVPAVVEGVEGRLAPLRGQLDALGPKPDEGQTEAEGVARERGALEQRIAELEGLLRRLELADARAAGIVDRLGEIRRRRFTERLMSRGPSILTPDLIGSGFGALRDKFVEIWRESAGLLESKGMAAIGLASFALLGLSIVLPVVILVAVRRAVMARLRGRIGRDMPPARKVAIGFGLTVTRLLAPTIAAALCFAGLLASGLLGAEGQALMAGLVRTLLLAIGAYALGAAYFAPDFPELRLSHLDESAARRANRLLIALTAVVGLDQMLLEQTSGFTLPVSALASVNFVLVTLGGVVLWRLVRTVWSAPAGSEPVEERGEDEPEPDDFEPRAGGGNLLPALLQISGALLLAVAMGAPLLAAAGYFAASRFLFYTPVFTAALIAFFVLLFTVVRATVSDVLVPSASGTRAVARLRLVPVMVGFILAALAIPAVALIWGAAWVDVVAAWRAVVAGVEVGEVVISPVDFALFLAVFGVGWIAVRVTQSIVAGSVLPFTALDTGGRAAVLAGIGYGGMVIAALIAVATTGFDLSNIAIVAGALSVGIGFGLQAIVSNFVSGLILLVERPIKAGDWVQLPSGMGYVKRINVRSTEIETFDRASLIVPNSELISNTVTNWTHHNLNGRVIAAVRVAHGSDLRHVEEVLLGIAKAHPMMLRKPAPFVLFRGFSDHALEFEIRGILRDVNWVLNVHSDLNFEIVRRFAEEGIVIPVPRSEIRVASGGAGWPGDLPRAGQGGREWASSRHAEPAGIQGQMPDRGEGLEADGGDGDGR